MAKPGIETVTPQLRFPQFGGANGWQVKPLGSICEVQNNRRRPITSNDRVPGPYPYYGASGVVDFVSDYIFDERLLLVGEDGAKWGRFESTAFIAEGKYWVNNHAHVLKAIEVKDSLLENYLTMLDIAPFVTGAAPPKLTLAKLKSIPIPVPPTSIEQQKIARCLTSLDEVIAAQGRKVEALKAHKRGLMQQLFPREGESRPRLRFPEFHNAPEWITRPLGELMVIGSSRRVHESDWTTAGVPFYRAREIVAIGKGEPINPLFISEALYREFAGSTGEIEEGQLLVTGVGSIGIPYLVKFGDRFYFKDGNIIWLKNNQADLAGNFLLRLFESDYVQGQIATMAGIGTVGTYTIDNAKRTVAIFPVDKCEQQRIADCLSSLDTQIAGESSQLAALKTHKQGLMQQLFPSLEGAK